jgi:lysophospholipase L1-like esterase
MTARRIDTTPTGLGYADIARIIAARKRGASIRCTWGTRYRHFWQRNQGDPTNDIAGNRGPTTLDWLERSIEAMVTLARHDGAIVILASIPPADHFGWIPSIHPAETIATANRALKAYAVREGLVWVDYYAVLADEHGGLRKEYSDDGVHPNPRGYAAMRASAERAIATALRQAPTAPSGDARPDTPR